MNSEITGALICAEVERVKVANKKPVKKLVIINGLGKSQSDVPFLGVFIMTRKTVVILEAYHDRLSDRIVKNKSLHPVNPSIKKTICDKLISRRSVSITLMAIANNLSIPLAGWYHRQK